MINKKIVLSILTVAFIGIAAAGTWANYDVSKIRDGSTISTGKLTLDLYTPGTQTFTVSNIIPGVDNTLIKHKVWIFPNVPYTITTLNGGTLPGDLYISKLASGTGGINNGDLDASNHIHLYCSENPDDSNPAEIYSWATKFQTVNPGTIGKTYFFWYAYDNVDSSTQNDEMGVTVNEKLTFELRNPDQPWV